MRHTARQRNSGQAVIPVLFVVLILTAFAVTVNLVARSAAHKAAERLHDTQEMITARAAVNYAAAELQQVTSGGTTPPDLTAPPNTDTNGWTELGDCWFKLEIVDTASRLNINTATTSELLKLPSLQNDYETVAAIADWRDSDDNETSLSGSTGAESSYYESLDPAYECKNAPFDTIGELLLVRGITPQALYGRPSGTVNPLSTTGSSTLSRQTTGTSSDASVVDTSGSTTPLAELLTTYSKELNVASDGTARVNVTSANASDLQSKLGLSSTLARALVSYRSSSTITSIADLLNISGFTRTIMQQIGDKVTVTNNRYRTGVVNINTAPAEVLATIPGVDQQTYTAVIEARENGTVFTGLNDLFQLTNLNRTQLITLVDHVCTKSSVYLVRVKVRRSGSSRVYVAQALVELADPDDSSSSTGTSSSLSNGSTSTSNTSSSLSSSNTSTTTPRARIVQWQEIPQRAIWERWSPPPATTSAFVAQ